MRLFLFLLSLSREQNHNITYTLFQTDITPFLIINSNDKKKKKMLSF
jgi:hypothetical protein